MARVWQRSPGADTPRPAGRRFARLRRGGSRATQVLARVTRRRRFGDDRARLGSSAVTTAVTKQPRRSRTPMDGAAGGSLTADVGTQTGRATEPVGPVAPVSPALPPTAPWPGGAGPQSGPLPRSLPGSPAGPLPSPFPLLPGERTTKRRIQFAVVTGCTVASILLGLGAVMLALGGEFRVAALALLACVLFDGCDGGLARRLGVASPFGAQLDSLADLSSFGVAAGIVVYHWLADRGASPAAAGPACALVVVCAAIRLARFNISPRDERFFSGVPTTMVAAVLALNILIGPPVPGNVEAASVAVYAVAMVTYFPYAKLGRVLRLPPWFWLVPAICAMISLPLTFVAVVAAYLISGPLLWLRLRNRPALAA